MDDVVWRRGGGPEGSSSTSAPQAASSSSACKWSRLSRGGLAGLAGAVGEVPGGYLPQCTCALSGRVSLRTLYLGASLSLVLLCHNLVR